MIEYKCYDYYSVLAPYIQDFISIKRKLGFIYNTQAYHLKRFDNYWYEHMYTETQITFERIQSWLCCLPNESKSSHSGRISAVRNLAVYMNTMGNKCYIPILSIGRDCISVHILSNKEMKELFSVIDSYVPVSTYPADLRMANEYPIMFRLYYCCGMRNNEVCALETTDVNLKSGILTIKDGKNHKNRLIYIPENLKKLTKKYLGYLKRTLGYIPFWFFPGRCPDKHVCKSQIDKKFSFFGV